MSTDSNEGVVDAKAIIDYFGGRQELHSKLIARGYDITIKAIDKWRERGSVKPLWLGVFAVMAKEQGRSFDLTQFVRVESVLE